MGSASEKPTFCLHNLHCSSLSPSLADHLRILEVAKPTEAPSDQLQIDELDFVLINN